MVRYNSSIFLLTCCITTASAFVPLGAQQQQHQHHGVAPLAVGAVAEMPPAPLTAWGETISDIRSLQQEYRKKDLPEFGPEISCADVGIDSTDKAAQLKYFQEHGMEIKQKMQDHGAVILRGFDLMKEQDGFQEFYAAIGMKICQDPLQSVAARPTADGQKDSPVYEAVNKESRKNFFIGKLYKFLLSFECYSI